MLIMQMLLHYSVISVPVTCGTAQDFEETFFQSSKHFIQFIMEE